MAQQMVAYSEVMGLLPCEIVGTNESHYLVRVCGMKKPLSVPQSLVFELAEGCTLEHGQIVGEGYAGPLAACKMHQQEGASNG